MALRNPIYTISVFASSSISLELRAFGIPYIAIAFLLFIFFFDIENKGMREVIRTRKYYGQNY